MSPSARRPRRSRLVVLAVGLLLVLGACTHQRQIPDKYGDTTRDNFTEGCIDAMTQESVPTDGDGFPESDVGDTPAASAQEAEDACTCAYEAISGEGGIPFDEFKEINAEQEEDPTALPKEILDRVDTCRADLG